MTNDSHEFDESLYLQFSPLIFLQATGFTNDYLSHLSVLVIVIYSQTPENSFHLHEFNVLLKQPILFNPFVSHSNEPSVI